MWAWIGSGEDEPFEKLMKAQQEPGSTFWEADESRVRRTKIIFAFVAGGPAEGKRQKKAASERVVPISHPHPHPAKEFFTSANIVPVSVIVGERPRAIPEDRAFSLRKAGPPVCWVFKGGPPRVDDDTRRGECWVRLQVTVTCVALVHCVRVVF